MGKRYKKRFRNICCLGEPSSDLQDGGVSRKEIGLVALTKSAEQSEKKTKVEILQQEVDKLNEKLKALEESLVAIEEKYRATEREIGAFFSESVVEKLAERYAYTAQPLVIYNKTKLCNDFDADNSISQGFSPSVEVTDRNGNLVCTEPTSINTNVGATPNAVHHVQPLSYHCRKMFYLEATSDDDTNGNKIFATDLARIYTTIALQNVLRGNPIIGLEYRQPLPLRKLCYELLAVENTGKLHENMATRLQCADDSFELSGRFEQTNEVGCGLAKGKRQLKERNFLDVSGLTDLIQPLSSMQVVLHQEIMTTLNFPFRVTLRDIMLKNKFNESHAMFLCVNVLMSLKHLHSLNMIYGRITPSRIIFTQYGYPCLSGVETFQTDNKASRPKARIEYTSPEQVKHEPVTEATDVLQAGILVYSMIYGRSPFKANTYRQTKANLLDDNFSPKFEPNTFAKDGRYFIRKLLRINPKDRFNLDRCKKLLDKAVKWFSTLNQDELFSQTYPSPFKGPLMRQIIAD